MKPEFEKIPPSLARSFNVKIVERDKRPLLTKAWHYHPEIEICYTVSSSGMRYVGNNISEYHENDLVILGPNLPHGFTTLNKSKQYVIQFTWDFLGEHFFEAAELKGITDLIERSKRGLILKGDELEMVECKIDKLYQDQSNFSRLLSLLEFLDYLSECEGTEFICTEKYSSHINESKLHSIKSILDYVEENFQKDISIKDACEIVNLTESAFYKFIKRHTNKKFTTILNEYRIDHASKLLVSSDMPISDVAYISGYNNFSHFNRTFKESYFMTPREFRKANQKVI